MDHDKKFSTTTGVSKPGADMHLGAGRIEIIVPQSSSDITREKVCTEIKKLLLDFAHYIGAFFEPEQSFDLTEQDQGNPNHLNITTKFRPDPLFYSYLTITLSYFQELSIQYGTGFRSPKNSFNIYSAIADLRESPLLESEEMKIVSKIRNIGSGLKKTKCKIDFCIAVHEKIFDLENFRSLERLIVSEKSALEFDNYEFEYELSTFSMSSSDPSVVIIGGEKYTVYFSEFFIKNCSKYITDYVSKKIKEKEYLPKKNCESYFFTQNFNANLLVLGLKNGSSSTFKVGNFKFSVLFQNDTTEDLRTYLVGKIGAKIKLRDHYLPKEKGYFYKGHYNFNGYYKDRETNFEFIS